MSGPIILVVDDEPEIQSLLRRGLTQAGYRAVFCRNGARAPRNARRLKPAAVVLDAVLGRGLNGFQICSILKQEPATRDIPVIMTSGILPAASSESQALKCGAAAYINKGQIWPALASRLDALLRPAPCSAAASSASAGELAPPGDVLVVDDQPEWIDLSRRLLEEAGHRVFSAADDVSAVELAARHRPDCIVLDYQLVRVTAPEVCRRLQARPETRGIPVVILTGDKKCRELCLEFGADQFVAKDAPITELPRAVEFTIRRYRWSAGILVKEDVRLDRRDRSVCLGGKVVAELAGNRFDFFYALVERSPQYVSRRDLARMLPHESELVEGSKALDKLAARTKEDLGKPLSDRIHQLKDLGWVYELPLPRRLAK